MKIKYILISLVYFQFISIVNAQETIRVNPAKKDSLQRIITNHPKADEEKVRLLNEYARECFYNLELLKGFDATREARLLSDKLQFEGGMIMYYLTLSAYHGNENSAMHDYYQIKAKWLSKNVNNELVNYYNDLQIPDIEFDNDYETWLKEYTKLLIHFEALDDKEIQAIILGGIGHFHFQLGDYVETKKTIDRIITSYTELNQSYPVFLYTNYKISLLRSQGKTEEVKKLELELVKLFTTNKEENAIGLIANAMAQNYFNKERFILTIEYFLKSVEAFERNGDKEMLAKSYYGLGMTYETLSMDSKAADIYAKSEAILELSKDSTNIKLTNQAIIFPLIAIGKFDEAKKRMAIALRDTINGNKTLILARYQDASGQILQKKGNYAEAIPFFKKGMANFNQLPGHNWAVAFMQLYLAECYFNLGDYKIAIEHGLKSYEMNGSDVNLPINNKKVSLLISKIYEKSGNQSMAYNYLKTHQEITEKSEKLDELNRIADQEIKAILDKSQKEINVLEKEKELTTQRSQTQRLWIFSVTGALLSALILALILYRNNKNKQKANVKLNQQKKEIETQKNNVEQTLSELKSTQAQLIQSEKMASLGELTAGIAHEIQNPLNFVNNFSEVSNELIDEMNEEIKKKDYEEVEAIASDLKLNLEKINHHGKRADAIVKGMLQHSRNGSTSKEPTDINKLADEYFRLAYHGLRAKDKTFNATLNTDFDDSIGNINVFPQDIGRVILNLITNAFYVVHKKKKSPLTQKGGTGNDYEPTVSVSTKKAGKMVHVSVTDNGDGIPDHVLEKIFQPFFTTKPTGEGTGLGLSLSYDIVKTHGGELKVETKQGEGTTFTIVLPKT